MARGAGPVVRDAKKAATRRALIEHAVALFESRGVERTTVDDIVAAAGCSQRTFFRHFTAKEDVVFDDIPQRLAEFSLDWEREVARFLVRRAGGEDPEGPPSDIDAEVVAAAVVSVLRAAWRGEVLHGGRFDELVGRALDRLERGLADL